MPPTTTAAPAIKRNLRQRTTRGIIWVAAQAVTTRGTMLLQQLALAWLLTKDDFGLIGLTYTVTTFVNLVANPGIDTILVQRHRRFRLWATPAFWLGLSASTMAMFLMIPLAQMAAWIYEQPQLIGLIVVLAIALPFQGLQIVPRAQLQMHMRFRAVAVLNVLSSVLTALITVAAAYLGMGAYSFVIPVPISAAAVAGAGWWLTRPPIRMRPEFKRWRYLMGTSATLFGTQVLNVFINQVDYMTLGIARFSEAAIGTYVFAFNVAVQSLRLVASSVMVVLFPGLSQMSLEPEKQARAALRATRLLMLASVPLCLLQVVLTEPMFRLLLPPVWNDAIRPCQVLTLGMMINSICWPAASLMKAQGRFRTQFWVTLTTSTALVVILAIAVWYRPSIMTVAIAVGFWHCLHSPFYHWAAFRDRVPPGSFLRETGPPLVAGLAAALPSILLQRFLPSTPLGDVLAIGVGGLVFAAVYLLVVYLLVPASVQDFAHQLEPAWQRLRRAPAESPAAGASRDDEVV